MKKKPHYKSIFKITLGKLDSYIMKKIILKFLISLVQFLSCQKFDNLIEIKSPSGLIKIMVLKNYDEWTYEVFYLDKKIFVQ